MSDTTSIIIAGVGGQGIILASRVLAAAALNSGYKVKVAETHGMAQRGGSVVTHLRYGSVVYSPLISAGQADYLIGFEKLEAFRCLPFLKEDGLMIVNDQEIPPLPVLLGKASYPELAGARAPRLRMVRAQSCAQQLGNSRVVNMVLLGCLARHLDIARECWDMAIEEGVNPRYRELNSQAFQNGLNMQ
jgi:indolepyruvate ferredoxin oxidoreductase beta subunit